PTIIHPKTPTLDRISSTLGSANLHRLSLPLDHPHPIPLLPPNPHPNNYIPPHPSLLHIPPPHRPTEPRPGVPVARRNPHTVVPL
ncbi:hypothetical protein, partial [Micrococcus luteus]|uniref:hypothetical protein n=1 Tax=Micrococcus luteus TaxID=1270 RepID=UPI001C92EDCE